MQPILQISDRIKSPFLHLQSRIVSLIGEISVDIHLYKGVETRNTIK